MDLVNFTRDAKRLTVYILCCNMLTFDGVKKIFHSVFI